MGIRKIYQLYTGKLDILKDLSPLFLRLLLAYSFYEPAMNKVHDIHAIGDWFREMGLPAPLLQAYLATTTECLGIILLFLGLGTRIIAIPLIVVLLVAIKTVHWENGFSAGNNGFEIPFYYIIMLLSLLFTGSGKISIDHILSGKNNTKLS